ncbi:MAG: MBOAT family protein [Butyricicoccus sp.]|nr:MBOAT family protein [Butyricicoccus sp.]
MLFNSYFFIFVFLPLSVIGYFALNRLTRPRYADYFLLAMSLWFYGANDLRSLPVLLISIVLNYLIGSSILSSPYRRTKSALLVCGILANLAALGVFKYLNFFLSNAAFLMGHDFDPIRLLLPLGISFFTFQQISYLVDARRGDAPSYSLSEYALYASFFPYVTSGPIAFHSEILPQLRDDRRRKPSAHNLSRGLTAFSFGLFKKVLVADTLGKAADWGWSNLDSLNSPAALVTILAYSLQLYFDFAGYSDMASGVALCFNIELPMNFDSPYRARDIADFWKRWHMTMTRFFTRYLYIPLGGSRHGLARTCLNTFIIFLVSGLWHGAAWTFILWGALHGIAMVIGRVLKARGCRRLPLVPAWLLTFAFVNLCWVFFRAPSIAAGGQLLSRLVLGGWGALPEGLTGCFLTTEFSSLEQFVPLDPALFASIVCVLFLLAALAGSVFPQNMQQRLLRFRPSVPLCLGSAALLVWSVLSLSGVSTFLYFTF